MPFHASSPGCRGFYRAGSGALALVHWLLGFLFLAAAFFSLSSCALKTVPDTGSAPDGQSATVLISLPAETEGLVSSELTPPLRRAWSSLRQGRFSEAERQFADAVASDSTVSNEGLAAAFTGLGFSRLGQGQYSESEEAFGQSLAAHPGYGPARMGLALLLRFDGKADESAAVYHQLSADHPDSAMLKREAAVVRSEAVQLLVRRGETAEDHGDPLAAADHFRQAVDLDPDMPRLRGLLAGALESGGRYDEALEALEQAMVLSDGDEADSYCLRLAWLGLERGQPDRAVTCFKALLQKTPGDPVLLDGLNRAEAKQRQALLPAEYLSLLEGDALNRGGLAAIIAVELGWDDNTTGTPDVRARVIRDTGLHWAQPYIRVVVNRKVMDLYQNHTFRPEMPVTRGELAFAACRLLRCEGDELQVEETVDISDLSRDHRHYDCICRLVGLGLLQQFPDNTVRVNGEATSADALLLISSIQRRLADRQP